MRVVPQKVHSLDYQERCSFKKLTACVKET
jgi:hypothetical protein